MSQREEIVLARRLQNADFGKAVCTHQGPTFFTTSRQDTNTAISFINLAIAIQFTMISRKILTSRTPRATLLAIPKTHRVILDQRRQAGHAADPPTGPDYPKLTDSEDPGMNGGYINPPFIKRQFRSPYGDYFDKQERRYFGEPVHEDDATQLGLFTPFEYTHVKPSTAFAQIGVFIAAVFGLCGTVYLLYPDRPSAPREFEDGLERELGGPDAVRARAPGDA